MWKLDFGTVHMTAELALRLAPEAPPRLRRMWEAETSWEGPPLVRVPPRYLPAEVPAGVVRVRREYARTESAEEFYQEG